MPDLLGSPRVGAADVCQTEATGAAARGLSLNSANKWYAAAC
jgi:hypothetical protein